MAARRTTFVVFLAVSLTLCIGDAAAGLPHLPVPPAPEQEPASGPLGVPIPGESVKNAVEVLESDLWVLLVGREYQSAVAAFAFVFGLFALLDGLRLYRMVVVASFAVVAFLITLSQLQQSWEGHEMIAKYAASFEAAVFTVFAAYKGWGGAQLVLGTIFGLFLFRTEQGLAALIPSLAAASQEPQWVVIVGTICAVLGVAMVHDRYGGRKVIGMFASLLGASLVVSAMGHLVMASCTLPSPPIHIAIKPEQVASVYEFWYMMVFPFQSQPVGLFTATSRNSSIGSYRLDWDRFLCIFFWMLFFFAGTRFQMRAAASSDASSSLKTRLLDVEGQVIAVQTPANIGVEGQVLKIEGDRRLGIEGRVIKIEA